jgi:hypothetical protein
MAAVAGVAYLKLDGTQYSLRGSFMVRPHNRTREEIVGQDGYHGYKETEVAPSIEAEITDRGGLSIMALQGITESTVTAELNNGKTYILNDAFFAGPIELDASDGKMQVKFVGARCIELLA